MHSRSKGWADDQRTEVFVSYAHADEKFRNEFETAIKPLVRTGALHVWSDQRIQAAQDWRVAIQTALERTRVAVLLASQKFLASEFIMNEEFPFLLEAAKNDRLSLAWVPLEDCLVETTPLADVQGVWDPKRPIKGLRGNNKSSAWAAIARRVGELASQDSVMRVDARRDDLLDRVAEATELRFEHVKITRIPAGAGTDEYLRVAREEDGFIDHFPIGVFGHPPTMTELESCIRHVVGPYRKSDPQMIAQVVYEAAPGFRLAAELENAARKARVTLKSFNEYSRPVPLGNYLVRQSQLLAQAEAYPSSLYVPQSFRERTYDRNGVRHENALDLLTDWMLDPNGCFALILGSFGTGKSFLMRELCRRLSTIDAAPVPLFIELRELGLKKSLDQLVGDHLIKHGQSADPKKLRYMIRHGRIALLFDGFDELVQRVTYDRIGSHFDTLLEAASESAKVVVTSRTQHFLTDQDVEHVLMRRAASRAWLRWGQLEGFDEPRIRHFLANRLRSEPAASEYFDLLRRIEDLISLSHTPRMLQFISRWDTDFLGKVAKRHEKIAAANLYQTIVQQWLEHDFKTADLEGAPPTLDVNERWRLVTALALALWPKLEPRIGLAELVSLAGQTIDRKAERNLEAAELGHLTGSRSLLTRDAEGNFAFEHQSILEWLVARHCAVSLAADWAPAPTNAQLELPARIESATKTLNQNKLSRLAVEFFCDLTGHDLARAWARSVVDRLTEGHEFARQNATAVLSRLGASKLKLVGQDLRGQDLSGLDLRGADLSGANLTDSVLANRDLSQAKLVGTLLVNANLRQSKFRGADWTDADLTRANLTGAELHEARGNPRSLWRAKTAGSIGLPNSWMAIHSIEDVKTVPATASAKSQVLSATWHCAGDILATGHLDGSVRLWDVSGGQELRRFSGHENSVLSVSFSPDGARLASASSDKTVRLWEVSSGQELRRFSGHEDPVLSVSFSPDGARLASASSDKTVRLWDVSSGQELRRFSGHENLVWSVLFGPDGARLASASVDKTVRLWDVSSGQELRRFCGHDNEVLSVSFSPDGGRLASGSDDKTVRLWDVSSGQELRRFSGHEDSVWSVSFSPDGARLASASVEKTVRLWDVSSGQELCRFSGHEDSVCSVSFSPDGARLASGSFDNSVRVWDVSSGQEMGRFSGHEDSVRSVSFSPDGARLASSSVDKTVSLWDVSSGQELRRFSGHESSVLYLSFSPDGMRLASASSDHSVRLWDVSSGQELRRFSGHGNSVVSVSFSPDGARLASGSSDKTVRLWDVSSGQELRRFSGHDNSVLSVSFSPDGALLASGSDDDSARLWDVSSGQELRRFSGHDTSVTSVSFSPDGAWLAGGSEEDSVRLWDVSSGQELRRFSGHDNSITSVSFSPDGARLASGSEDNTVRLWDVSSGQELRRLDGHGAPVGSIAFHRSGRFLVSGSEDGTVKLWDIESGTCLMTLCATAEGWVAYLPDGRYKLSGKMANNFWHVIGLCRYDPGELDPYFPKLRLPLEEKILSP